MERCGNGVDHQPKAAARASRTALRFVRLARASIMRNNFDGRPLQFPVTPPKE